MSGLLDEEDVPNFPGCKPDDWQNPFPESNGMGYIMDFIFGAVKLILILLFLAWMLE